jgi:hypothetical protein
LANDVASRLPTALQSGQNNIVQYIIDCVRISKTTKCALTATYGFLPAELHGLQGGASKENIISYGVDRPNKVKVRR